VDKKNNTETVACPNCLALNSPRADFCRECDCPIGELVNLDPLKRIWSQGWIYRKAAFGSTSRFILCGIWLLFGTAIIMVPGLILWEVEQYGLYEWIFAVCFFMVYAVILFRVTRNYIRKSRPNIGERP